MREQPDLLFGGYFHPFPFFKGERYLNQFELTLGRKIDVALWYQQWGAGWGVNQWNGSWLKKVGDRQVMIKWEPSKPGAHSADPRFSIESILNGKHD